MRCTTNLRQQVLRTLGPSALLTLQLRRAETARMSTEWAPVSLLGDTIEEETSQGNNPPGKQNLKTDLQSPTVLPKHEGARRANPKRASQIPTITRPPGLKRNSTEPMHFGEFNLYEHLAEDAMAFELADAGRITEDVAPEESQEQEGERVDFVTDVKPVLAKQFYARTPTELRQVAQFLVTKAFFAQLPHDALMQISRLCSYQEVAAEETVIEQGQKGECFYAVFSGSLEVYKRKPPAAPSATSASPVQAPKPSLLRQTFRKQREEDTHRKTSLKKAGNAAVFVSSISPALVQVRRNEKRWQSVKANCAIRASRRSSFHSGGGIQTAISALTKLAAPKVSLFFEKLRTLYDGDTFGESSLLNNEARWTETVKAVEPSGLLVLDRHTFNRYLKNARGVVFQPNLCRKILKIPPRHRTVHDVGLLNTSVSHMTVFQGIPLQLRNRLMKWMLYEHKDSGELVCKQGEVGDAMFVVLSGSANVHIVPFDQAPGRATNVPPPKQPGKQALGLAHGIGQADASQMNGSIANLSSKFKRNAVKLVLKDQ
ncbi:hypothetical protein CYMTET_51003, partial [Cymbomonas tetramitiformis]